MKSPKAGSSIWLWCLFAAAIGAIAVSNQSLWIDEGGTAYKAIQPTLRACWDALWWERNTNLQLPLYFLYIWSWTKLFGASEYALRAANIPCLVLCVLALRYLFAAQRTRFVWAALFLLTSPFVWYYADEARPYLLILAPALFLFASVYRFCIGAVNASESAAAVRTLAISSVVLGATSMLAGVWIACSALALCYCDWRRLWRSFRASGLINVLAVVALGVIAGYYLWLLKVGVNVTRLGQNFFTGGIFAVYELFGFAGLGPSRLALRQSSAAAVAYAVPLSLLALCWSALLLNLFVRRDPPSQSKALPRTVWLLLLTPILVVMFAGLVQHARILPRYFTPSFPLIIFLGAAALDAAWRRGSLGKVTVIAFVALSAVSAAQLRFLSRHDKEDYRRAAAFAQQASASARRVFWGADVQTAIYYGVLAEDERSTGSHRIILDRSRLADCVCVVLSRVDIYDPDGVVRRFVTERGFVEAAAFQGFRIYCSPGVQLSSDSRRPPPAS